MMNKLEMAHECAMKLVGNPTTPLKTIESIIGVSWNYADAMQAEADKRETGDAKQKLTGGRALQKTFIDGIEQPRYSDEQWQPDWSQAPEWANWAAVGSLSKKGVWSVTEPEHINIQGVDYWDVTSPRGEECKCYSALTSYTGDWRDSVRKRP